MMTSETFPGLGCELLQVTAWGTFSKQTRGERHH